eukprot:CAMPEP_0195079066 /NCGR_PEP_ID=MMETSP0448-20130528/21099_1 /TAXON_ID=66468 /ORGANISM="Heterocapsa triquestra, Strain CCMP 448" /LENGTH=35 /DNA_ID= /DNA_START= /DNA_END= /DNA_ORIENTATION=
MGSRWSPDQSAHGPAASVESFPKAPSPRQVFSNYA